MTRLQRLFIAILPRRWAQSMETESRSWMLGCPSCGYEISVWDAGGVRWKAKGRPWALMRCPQCGKTGWTRLHRSDQQ
jgi:predicted RNA-binding Zn-ribbon protein involved in translation (DUF1610 family)